MSVDKDSIDFSELLGECATILGVEQLRLEDDFFSVGGNSLDAAEISEMLERRLGRTVAVEQVLRGASFCDMFSSLVER